MFTAGLGLSVGFLFSSVPAATVGWFLMLMIGLWLVPFLNYKGFRKLSRHVLSSVLPLFLVFFVAHIRSTFPDSVHGASFYIPRFFLLGISFLPIILFGFEEKYHLIGSFSINVLLLLFYNEIMDVLGAGLGIAELPVSEPFFISITSVVALIIMSGGYFFLSKLNTEYEQRIQQLLIKTRTQNENMQAALNYAQNIQQIILPRKERLDGLSDKLFAHYQPLHTVSGDFYFIEETESHLLLAVIDCTGHGVPGAIMSIMANSALQRAINVLGIEEPHLILGLANKLFHEDVTHSGSSNIKDGMDLIVVSIKKEEKLISMAGANLSAYWITSGEIQEMRTDKGGIAAGSPDREFTKTQLQLKRGDQLYLTTDGYYDQFGGDNDKRIGKRRFRELLLEVSALDIPAQKLTVANYFNNWMGDAEQIDDVCVVGLSF
mgnify:CR=1 FL=1